jgi:uncharacterized protein (TIGR03083 family)
VHHPLSNTYREGRERLLALAAELTDAEAATMTTACPAWSIKDVYAHLAGIATDIVTGNTEGAATEAWADGHVADRRSSTLADVTAEWAEAGRQVSALVETSGELFPPQLFIDQWTHEWDIRAALGPRAAAVADNTVFDHLLEWMEKSMANDPAAADLPRLDLMITNGTDSAARTIGFGVGEPIGAFAMSLFDYSRLSMGRRSADQIDALAWPPALADPDRRRRYVDVLVRWSVADQPVIDPSLG